MKYLYSSALAIVFLLSAVQLHGQSYSTWFSDITGGDYCGEVIRTSDGGYLMITQTSRRVIKTNSVGSPEWAYQVDTSAIFWMRNIIQTSDNGFVIMGFTNESNSRIVIIKLDATGNELWQKFYGASSNMTAECLAPSVSDAGFLIGGGNCAYMYYYVKFDPNGEINWQKRLNNTTNPGNGYIQQITTTNNGYYLMFSRLISGDLDVGVAKVDTSGNILWSSVIEEGVVRDDPVDMVTNSAGGVTLLCKTAVHNVPASFNLKPSLAGLDANGNLLWYKVYNYGQQIEIASLVQTSDNGYVFTGITNYPWPRANQIVLAKTNSTGVLEWDKVTGSPGTNGSGSDESGGLALGEPGTFVLSGTTGSEREFLTQIDNGGQAICWQDTLTLTQQTPAMTVSHPVIVTSTISLIKSTSVYASSTPEPTATYPCMALSNESLSLQNSNAVSVFPNPFSESFTVRFPEAFSSQMEMVVTNLEGKTAMQKLIPVGEISANIQIPGMDAGIYFVHFPNSDLPPVKLIKY